MTKSSTIKNSTLFATGTYFEENSNFFRLLERKNPTEYDKIMDAVYKETHIGGGTHRHFDGSHTLHGSWDKISETTGDVELTDFIKSHFNELVTPEGIPLLNLDHQYHGQFGHEISEALGGIVTPGFIKSYLRDMNSFNLGELAAGSLGAGFLGWSILNGDSKAISRVTACNLTLGLVTGNPTQVLVGLAGLGHGVYTGKIKSFDLLKGALPILSGIGALKLGNDVLEVGGEYSMLMAVASSIGASLLINKVTDKQVKRAKEELGDRKDYLLVMSPNSLRSELQMLEHKKNSVGIAI